MTFVSIVSSETAEGEVIEKEKEDKKEEKNEKEEENEKEIEKENSGKGDDEIIEKIIESIKEVILKFTLKRNKEANFSYLVSNTIFSSGRAVIIGPDFFLELWKKIYEYLPSYEKFLSQGDYSTAKEMKTMRWRKKLRYLNEASHALESSLRTVGRLTPEYGSKSKGQGDMDYENIPLYKFAQQRNLGGDCSANAKIIQNFVNRHGPASVSHLPHIHHIVLDKEERIESNAHTKEADEKMAVGAFHRDWKNKIRNGLSPCQNELHDYLIHSEECRIGGNILHCDVSCVIQTFIEEYPLQWKSLHNNQLKEYGFDGSEIQQKEKLTKYYPQCHFCGKVFFDIITRGEGLCCDDVKLLSVLKKRITELFECQIFAEWKKSTLFDISAEIENLRVRIMVEEGRNFLKSTADKMHFTYGEIAKLLLAVALGRQKKGSTGYLCIEKGKSSESFTSMGSETTEENVGDGIVGSRNEAFWRQVMEVSGSQSFSAEKDRKRQDLRITSGGPMEDFDSEGGIISRTSKSKALLHDDDTVSLKSRKNREQDKLQRKKRGNGEIDNFEDENSEKIISKKRKKGTKIPAELSDDDVSHTKGKKSKSMKASANTTKGKGKKTRGKGNSASDSDDEEGSTKSGPRGKRNQSAKKKGKKSTSGKDSKKTRKGGESEDSDDSTSTHSKSRKMKSSEKSKGKKEKPGKKSSKYSSKGGKGSEMSGSTYAKQIEKSGGKIFGYIPYSLSDAKYVECAWSNIPKDIHTKKVAVYEAMQRKTNISWCADSSIEEQYMYLEGSVFATFRHDGTGEIFYPDGRPAIIISRVEKKIEVTVFSVDEKKPSSIWVIGKFDSFGHGIIYDDEGKVRMQFTQTWGVCNDFQQKKTIKWKWGRGLMLIAKNKLKSDSPVQENTAVEQLNRKELNGKGSSHHGEVMKFGEMKNSYSPLPFLILHLNANIIFRLFDQSDMCLIFESGVTGIRLEFGAVVDVEHVAYYDAMIDHDLEKCSDIPPGMASIHDRDIPPPSQLPSEIIHAPEVSEAAQQQRLKHLFLHRAIMMNANQVNEK